MTADSKNIEIHTMEDESVTSYHIEENIRDDDDDRASKDSITDQVSRMTKRSTPTAENGEAMDGIRSDKRVRLFRDTALMLLLLSAIFVSTAVYISLMASELREFENTFDDQASQVGQALKSQLEAKLWALGAFSVSITSYARSQLSSDWPNISVPDFAERASSTLRASKGIALAIHPVVRDEDLVEWEEYAVQSQTWLQESLDFQSRQSETAGSSSIAANISEFVYRVVDGIPSEVQGSDTLLPLWEHFPAHDGLPPVNYDALSDRLHKKALNVVMDTGLPVLGQAFDLSRSFHG